MSNVAQLYEKPEVEHVEAKPEPSAKGADAAQKKKRLRLFGGLAASIAVLGGGYYAYDTLVLSRHAVTDNAYVGADVAQVTPQIGGTVAEVPINDTMHVKRGQVLVMLDRADTEIAFAQAQANYAQAVRHVRQYFANSGEAAAQVDARASDMKRATLDYNRRTALFAAGAISTEQLTTARNTLETAHAGYTAAQQALQSQQALIHGVDADHNPEVLAAKAALDKARLDLSRTVIRAPIDGVVSKRDVQVGQRVQPGIPLMMVVPIQAAYVDANFKEVQLAKVRPGQPVTLTSDLYGDSVVYTGHVIGFSGGTGAAFAIVPAQNATGNWIKVVQRLPVRIALDPRELKQHPLQVGLSMTADVNVAS
jgi:membrane fusion protein (multidrug efflux system)